MKSKWLSGKAQGWERSSMMNLQFGGIQEGSVGERSMPVTEAEGKLSAKSLVEGERHVLSRGHSVNSWVQDAHRPHSCPCSHVENSLRVFEGCQEKLVVKGHLQRMVTGRVSFSPLPRRCGGKRPTSSPYPRSSPRRWVPCRQSEIWTSMLADGVPVLQVAGLKVVKRPSVQLPVVEYCRCYRSRGELTAVGCKS